jgi:ABC-2 type transport system permease protein
MRATLATLAGAFAEVRANRGSFWTQFVAMVVNDLAWVVFWVLFFRRVGAVRGWDVPRVMLLQATLTVSGGLVLGLCANARRLGALAADGGLDAVLALPVHPLAHLLARRVDAANLGDIGFGVVVFAVAGAPTPGRAAVFALVVLAGALTLGGFLVATGSLAFFGGRSEAGEAGFNAMLMLAAYPADIFTGVPWLLVHSVVPAAFVATVPASLVDSFDPALALALAGAGAGFATAGWALFTLGLRRYTSGSVWTRP